MNRRELHLVVPGPLDQRTGGYLYDARMATGLRERGWTVVAHALEGVFPDADARAEASLERALAALPAEATVLLDGLGAGALPRVLEGHAARLVLLALVHHPLADETGLSAPDGERLALLERRALAACRGVIVTSDFTAGRLAAYGVPAARIRAVLPGTDPAPAAAGPAPGEPPRLLCVGSVTPRKGHDVLVAALERISDLPWSCVCAGSLARAPDFAEGVLSRVRGAGLAGRIAFAGECREEALETLYHTASVFVLPSYFEGYGMALGEALARGIAVVSTRAGAIPETVPEGAGVLVEPGDPDALAGALRALLAGPEGAARRDDLAAVALRHGMALRGWDEAAAEFERAVTELSADDGSLGGSRVSRRMTDRSADDGSVGG